MSTLDCYLAAEKPMDGKPFTVCLVGTWFYISLALVRDEGQKHVRENAARLFDEFHDGVDKSERGATLEELQDLEPKSNGGVRIIPKTKDAFINVEDWKGV